MSSNHKQKGFVLLLFIVVVVLIASLWISTQHKSLISMFKNQQIERDFTELYRVKDRLIEFAMLQPEIYKTDTSGELQTGLQIPSLGYLPCPDLDGNGLVEGSENTTCFNTLNPGDSTTGFVPDPTLSVGLGACDGSQTCVGYVPREIQSRNVYFAEEGRFMYFLDERFTYNNPNYGTQKRFAPLMPLQFDVGDSDADNDPVLTLNGEGGYIALIIDPGNDGLDAVNSDGDWNFVSSADDLRDSPTADQIIGITYMDWTAWATHRICAEKDRIEGLDADFTAIDSAVAHWYNAYDATNNPGGANWRLWAVACP